MASLKALQKILDPIRRRIRGLVSRAVVSLVDDSLKLQGLQLKVLADEVLDNVERFQQYGLSSHALPGAEAILLCLGGHRDHPVVIAVDDRRYRLKNLASGEVALYTDEGDKIHFRRGRIIEINGFEQVSVNTKVAETNATVSATVTSPAVVVDAQTAEVNAAISATVTSPVVAVVATSQVTLNTPLTSISGNLTVAGAILSNTSIADPAGTLAEARGYYNSHTHPGAAPAYPVPLMT